MKSFYKLSNVIQSYAWGSKDGISGVTGQANPEQRPMAELWMGTHPSACSNLETGFSEIDTTFLDIVNSDMKDLNHSRFKGQQGLPYLFKLLSAASPLSLQVHPTLEQAVKGFQRENAEGIPVNAANRNYKDANHKPEIMAAVTPFQAMCGFRPVKETVTNLRLLHIAVLTDITDKLDKTEDYHAFVEALLSMKPETAQLICTQLSDRIQARQTPTDAVSTELEIALTTSSELLSNYPRDIGVLAPFYLNVLTLNPGEALFLPAGIMHAYLKGTGFELMANSDNVLRGGLTPKFIDIPELLSILDSRPFIPTKIVPEKANGLLFYPTPAEDFLLGTGKLKEGKSDIPGNAPTILICIDGVLSLSSSTGENLSLTRGEVCYIRPNTSGYELSGTGECWFATLPDEKERA